MASKKQWDFECPQYVDFRAGLDNNVEDIFFDCTDNFSPSVEKAWQNVPAPANNLTEEDENKLIDKMTAALSFLGNTPKIKKNTLKEKLFSEKVPPIGVVHPVRPTAKCTRPSVRRRSKSTCDMNKIHTNKNIKTKEFRPKRSSSLDDLKVMKKHTNPKTPLCLKPSIRRCSKSIHDLNKIHTDKHIKTKELRPRNSSLDDLRVMKKHTYPKTPLCLKRTINAKNKKLLKTSEEMELELIAGFQKQLTQLLRNNEISYNKMKRRQNTCIPKNIEKKPEILKGNTSTNTDQNMRQNVNTMSRTAMRQTMMKLDGIINRKEFTHKTPQDIYRNILENSVSSSIISEDFNRSRDQVPKKHANVNFGFHSGLLFKGSIKRPTLKSLKIEATGKEMKTQNTHANQKPETSLTRSVSNDDVFQGKENIPVVKNLTHIQKIKIDAKLLATNKEKIAQRKENPMRGFPLAENTTRN